MDQLSVDAFAASARSLVRTVRVAVRYARTFRKVRLTHTIEQWPKSLENRFGRLRRRTTVFAQSARQWCESECAMR